LQWYEVVTLGADPKPKNEHFNNLAPINKADEIHQVKTDKKTIMLKHSLAKKLS